MSVLYCTEFIALILLLHSKGMCTRIVIARIKTLTTLALLWKTGAYQMDGLFRYMRSEVLQLMHARNGAWTTSHVLQTETLSAYCVFVADKSRSNIDSITIASSTSCHNSYLSARLGGNDIRHNKTFVTFKMHSEKRLVQTIHNKQNNSIIFEKSDNFLVIRLD